jgi:hypothetical protein
VTRAIHLKKVATYALILIISFAYGYETIEYFSIVRHGDFHTEENSESDESNEKNERSLSDDNYFIEKHLHYRLIANPMELDWASAHRHGQNNNFPSNDYSHEVYSPPEGTVTCI